VTGNLRADQEQVAEPIAGAQRQGARDARAGVMGDDVAAVEVQRVEHAAQRFGLPGEAEIRLRAPTGLAGAGQVDRVAGELSGQVRNQAP
jgi:hypothetical protein